MAGFLKRKRMAVLAVGVGVAVAAAPALAGIALTGNPKGIKLAHAVLRAMAHTRVQTYSETGYVVMTSAEGKNPVFEWEWGTGQRPAGWVKATEQAVVWLRHGRVTAWMDELTPVPCGTPICAMEVPVELVVDHSGRYYAYGDSTGHTCFARLNGTTPFRYGSASYAVAGKVNAPVKAGSASKLTYVYPYGHQVATETDVIATAASKVRSGRVRISKTSSASGFAFAFHYRYPAHAPKQPHVVLCGG